MAKVWLLKIVINDVVRGRRPGLLPTVCAADLAIAAAKGLLPGALAPAAVMRAARALVTVPNSRRFHVAFISRPDNRRAVALARR